MVFGSLVCKKKTTDEELIHKTEKGYIQEVRFIIKVIPDAIRASKGGGFHSAKSWVPEFRYSVVLNGKTQEKVWSAPATSVEMIHGFEVIALFGNTELPSENFQSYWKSFEGKMTEFIETENGVELLLGKKTNRKDVQRLLSGTRLNVFLLFLPLIWLLLRFIAFQTGWQTYRYDQLVKPKLVRPHVSVEFVFDHVTESGTIPYMLRKEEDGKQVVFTIYKMPAFPFLNWFSRGTDEVADGIVEYPIKFDEKDKKWKADILYGCYGDLEYFLKSGEDLVKLAAPPHRQ